MQIYVRRNRQRAGPFSLEEINRHLATGAFEPGDEAWSEGSPGWKPLLSFRGVIVPGGASSTAMPIALATPKDVMSQRYAGFWIRAVAFIIDIFIVALLAMVVVIAFDYLDGRPSFLKRFVPVLVWLVYVPVMWASPGQATLGQRICRLRVITRDSGAMSLPRGVLRVLGMILSAAILGVGYIMIAFTADKSGLHDLIAGTRVVRL